MALLWIDGFEQYNDIADLQDAYDSSQPLSITMVTGRNTGGGNNQAVEIDFNNSNLKK